jgi:hypothetical protein
MWESSMNIDLPEDAKVGSIVHVTYPQSGAPTIIPGSFDGRIIGIDGPRITVHFIYGVTEDPPEETLVLNLETGLDESYNVTITDVQLRLPTP